tara:strand:- start:538 stop:774 length:237 start_codon:yes stop_codon:yes gene_type:complete
MEYNTQQSRLKHLIKSSGTLATYINDIFDAAQKQADIDNEEAACEILDSGQEVLFELKRIELLSSLRDEIITDKLTNE